MSLGLQCELREGEDLGERVTGGSPGEWCDPPVPITLLHAAGERLELTAPGAAVLLGSARADLVFSLFQDVGKTLSRYETGSASLSSRAALLGRGLEMLQAAEQQQPGGRWLCPAEYLGFNVMLAGARGRCTPVKDGVPVPIAGTQLP